MVADKLSILPSPMPKSPRTDVFSDQLGQVIKTDGLVPLDHERQVLCGRLDRSWQDAVDKYRIDTGKDLGDYRGGKDGVLGALRKRYAEDNDDTWKKDELWTTIDKALNCVAFVGDIAAQVGSMVFLPAHMCFGAIHTLISIPQAFRKLRDDLHALFNQIVSFFDNFKILNRVDNQFGLDIALVEKTNEILLAMLDVCRLSDAVSQRKIRTVMGTVFFKNDAVQAALENFRCLIEEQNKLTSTITLETALQIKATSQAMHHAVTRFSYDVNDISQKVDVIQAFQTDDKNIKANLDRIAAVDMAFHLTEDEIRQPHRYLEQCRSDMLDNTMSALESQDVYQRWSRSKSRREILLVEGESGSGRTYLLAELNRIICHEKDALTRGDRKKYVAYYVFQREDVGNEQSDWAPLRRALMVMAAQVTRQSENYTGTLSKELETVKDARDLESFWRGLKLEDFHAPEDSILYLLFDGVDQLKIPLKNLRKALDPAITTTDRSSKSSRKLRLRIILTGNNKTFRAFQTSDGAHQELPSIDMSRVNKPLLRCFAERQMNSILSDGSILNQSAKLTEVILEHATGTFTSVKQRFEIVKSAVSSGLDYEELFNQLQSRTDSDMVLTGADILDKVCSTLSSENQQQLKEILYWAVYGLRWFDVKQLEAVLFLRRQKESLEPLKSKIQSRFKLAAIVMNDIVMANRDVEQYIRDADTPLTSPSGPSRITLEVKIENASELTVKQFFWDLNNAMTSGSFDFTNGLEHGGKATQEPLRFSYAEGHYTIAIRCLQALNDERLRSKIKPFLSYACDNLPGHIYHLKSKDCYESLLPDQRRALGQGVVGFLSDTECVDSVWSLESIPSDGWMYNHANVCAIGHLLTEPLILRELEPRDRRMAERMTRQTRENPVPFLEPLAKVAASRWLDSRKAIEGQEEQCFHNVNAYLHLLETDFDSLRFRPDKTGQSESFESNLPQGMEAISPNPEAQATKDLSTNELVADQATIVLHRPGACASPIEASNDISVEQPSPLQQMLSLSLNQVAQPQAGESDHVSGSMKPPGQDLGHVAQKGHVDSDTHVMPASEAEEPIDPKSITANRVEKALHWSLRQLGLDADSFIYQRVGNVLVNTEDHAAAVDYLKQAYETAPNGNFSARLKIACDLAKAYARTDPMKAYHALDFVIAESRSPNKGDGISEKEKFRLSDTLKLIAARLVDNQDDHGAVCVLEDALTYSPQDGDCRRDLMRLLCTTKRWAEAEKLFNRWMQISSNDRSQGPQAHFMGLARANKAATITATLYSARQSPLYTSILRALTDAIEHEGDDTAYADKSALHFARGLALAIAREDEGLQTARNEWENCIDKHAPTNARDNLLFAASCAYSVQYHFDLYRRRLLQDKHIAVTEKKNMYRNLWEIVDTRVQADTGSLRVYSLWTYVAAFAHLAGLDEEVKEILQPDVARMLDVLRDDDPENDGWGLTILCKILLYCGDIPGVRSAWSLFDRGSSVPKLTRRWTEQVGNGDLDASDHVTTQRRRSITGGTGSDIPEGEVTKAASGIAQATSSTVQAIYTCCCDGCAMYLSSDARQEIWWCTFCPNLDFCATCYDKLKNKQLDKLVCSHDHVHVKMLHFDYYKAEVKGQNVRVGWQFTGQEDDKIRQRKGGKIIDLQDWINGLERDWNAPRDN